MTPLLTDENFHGPITRGLRAKQPGVDLVRAQDVGLSNTPDPVILEWAAQHGRILLTHDITTIPPFAIERINQEKRMPGVVVVIEDAPVGKVLEDLILLLDCSFEGEWENRIAYIPF